MEDFLEALFSWTLFMETVDFQSFNFSNLGPALASCIDIDIVDSVDVVITFYSSLNGDVVEYTGCK